MTRKEIYAMLRELDIPIAYRSWASSKAPELPYAVYFFISSDDVYADDASYVERGKWCLELYSKGKDDEHEAAIKQLMKERKIPYSVNEVGPVSDNGPSMTAFYFSTI